MYSMTVPLVVANVLSELYVPDVAQSSHQQTSLRNPEILVAVQWKHVALHGKMFKVSLTNIVHWRCGTSRANPIPGTRNERD